MINKNTFYITKLFEFDFTGIFECIMFLMLFLIVDLTFIKPISNDEIISSGTNRIDSLINIPSYADEQDVRNDIDDWIDDWLSWKEENKIIAPNDPIRGISVGQTDVTLNDMWKEARQVINKRI